MRHITWKQKAKIAWLVLFHRRTPFSAKAVLLGGVLYGIMPIDLIPDFLPVIGMTDDALLLIIAVFTFLHLTKHIRKEMEHENDVIDVRPL